MFVIRLGYVAAMLVVLVLLIACCIVVLWEVYLHVLGAGWCLVFLVGISWCLVSHYVRFGFGGNVCLRILLWYCVEVWVFWCWLIVFWFPWGRF